MSKAQVGRCPLLLVLLTLFLVSALPVADAQVPHIAEHPIRITAEYDDSAVVPITERREVRFDVSVQCPRPSIEAHLEPHKMQFDVKSEASWASPILDRTIEFVTFSAEECLQGAKKSVQVVASIAFAAQAPAFEHAKFRFTANIDSGEEADHEFDLRTGFYERWQARFEDNIVLAEPLDKIQIPLTIENHGNAAIQTRFQVNEQTGRMLLVAIPGQQMVGSLQQGAETNRLTLAIDVQPPSDGERRDLVVIDIDGNSADDTAMHLSPLQVTAVVHTTTDGGKTAAMAEELPGLTPLAMFFVLFIGLGMRRR